MKTQRMIMAGTLAFAMTLGGNAWTGKVHANPNPPSQIRENVAVAQDDFQKALGRVSDEEVYQALYDGGTLADIAIDHHTDVQPIIDLQVRQLQQQLDERLAAGSISLQQYQGLKDELVEIVSNSVYGR